MQDIQNKHSASKLYTQQLEGIVEGYLNYNDFPYEEYQAIEPFIRKINQLDLKKQKQSFFSLPREVFTDFYKGIDQTDLYWLLNQLYFCYSGYGYERLSGLIKTQVRIYGKIDNPDILQTADIYTLISLSNYLRGLSSENNSAFDSLADLITIRQYKKVKSFTLRLLLQKSLVDVVQNQGEVDISSINKQIGPESVGPPLMDIYNSIINRGYLNPEEGIENLTDYLGAIYQAEDCCEFSSSNLSELQQIEAEDLQSKVLFEGVMGAVSRFGDQVHSPQKNQKTLIL